MHATPYTGMCAAYRPHQCTNVSDGVIARLARTGVCCLSNYFGARSMFDTPLNTTCCRTCTQPSLKGHENHLIQSLEDGDVEKSTVFPVKNVGNLFFQVKSRSFVRHKSGSKIKFENSETTILMASSRRVQR